MQSIDLQQFVSAGYFLIREGNPGWERLKTDYLPETLLSASDCITPKLEVQWGWITGDRQAAVDFGVREDKLDEFLQWCGYNFNDDLWMWSSFHSPDTARKIANQYLSNPQNLHIVGIALPPELASAEWHELTVEDHDYGIDRHLAEKKPLAEGGAMLGFEAATYEYGSFAHSWLCYSLTIDAAMQFGIQPGKYGLLQSEVDAQRLREWMLADEEIRHPDRLLVYDYYLLVDYPLK